MIKNNLSPAWLFMQIFKSVSDIKGEIWGMRYFLHGV